MLRSHGVFLRDRSGLHRVLISSGRSPSGTRKRWATTTSKTNAGDGTAEASKRPSTTTSKAAPTIEGQDVPPKRKRGRPRKSPTADDAPTQGNTSTLSTSAPPQPPVSTPHRRTKLKTQDLSPRLTALASSHHNTLATFLRYARQKSLNPTSNVYRGTHYEYTCIKTLGTTAYNFELYRTGRANDLGIDLIGWWKLPTEEVRSDVKDGEGEGDGKKKRKRKHFRKLKVLAQCKLSASRPKPAMIRELEGAYVGAPAGWNGSSTVGRSSPSPSTSSPPAVLALLLTTGPATKGVLAALQRSRWPMGLLQISTEGEVKQFLWNAAAGEEAGLGALGVVVRYSEGKGKGGKNAERRKVKGGDGRDEGDGRKEGGDVGGGDEGKNVKQSVRLSWMGRLWRA